MKNSNDISIFLDIALNPTTGKVTVNNVVSQAPVTPPAPKNIPNREALVTLLGKNIATITFIKADGSKRVMKCTRNPEIIEAHGFTFDSPTGVGRTINEAVLAVFDLDIGEWRSMTIAKILTVEMVF